MAPAIAGDAISNEPINAIVMKISFKSESLISFRFLLGDYLVTLSRNTRKPIRQRAVPSFRFALPPLRLGSK